MTCRFECLLDQVAIDFFRLKISVPELPKEPHERNEDGLQYIMRLNFDNREYMAQNQAQKLKSLELDSLAAPVSSDILLQLFPFIFVFDAELTIIAIGDTLRKMYPGNALMGKKLPEVARLRRPKAILSWNNVNFIFSYLNFEQASHRFCVFTQCRMLQRAMCELEVLPKYATSRIEVNVKNCGHRHADGDERQRPLILRGQLRYEEDWKAIMFLCNPL